MKRCPRQDSNLRTRLRRAVLYPLSYGGGNGRKGTRIGPAVCDRVARPALPLARRHHVTSVATQLQQGCWHV